MRAYGLDAGVLHTPTWLLNILIEQLPAIEAQEQLNAATIALLPWMDAEGRRTTLRTWRRLARRLEPEPPSLDEQMAAAYAQVIEHNPEKARAYFASLGVAVTETAENEESPC